MINIKKLILGLLFGIIVFSGAAMPAFATIEDFHPQGSFCGQFHGNFQFWSHGTMKYLYPDPKDRHTSQFGGDYNSSHVCHE